jgi:hypothetical protein
MAYVPINVQAYTAGYSGAVAGMAVNGWITSPTGANYTLVCAVAGAFAEAFDVAWNNAAQLNSLELAAIQQACAQEFSLRGPGPLAAPQFQDPANWAVPAKACATLALQCDLYFAGQGITPPSPGGGSASPMQYDVWVGAQGTPPASPNGIGFISGAGGPFPTVASALTALNLVSANPCAIRFLEQDFSAELVANFGGLNATLYGNGGTPWQLNGGPLLPATIQSVTAVYGCQIGAFEGVLNCQNCAIKTASPIGDLRNCENSLIIADIGDISNATILRTSFGPCVLGQVGTPRVDEFSLHSMGIQGAKNGGLGVRTWQVLDTGITLQGMLDADLITDMSVGGVHIATGQTTAGRQITVNVGGSPAGRLFRVDNYNNADLQVADGTNTYPLSTFTRHYFQGDGALLTPFYSQQILAV